jgi:hypothetical protein
MQPSSSLLNKLRMIAAGSDKMVFHRRLDPAILMLSWISRIWVFLTQDKEIPMPADGEGKGFESDQDGKEPC